MRKEMSHSEEFNCIYCEKRYTKRGWLARHIKEKHNDDELLNDQMTVLRDNALDLSTNEAAMKLSENSPWDNTVLVSSSTPISTPRTAAPVPLCPRADNYIARKGKTLPASFLETLLPAPRFLDELNKSLETQDNVDNLLERFEEDIRVHKCEVCLFTCTGSISLKNHMKTNHDPRILSSRQNLALPSLGDYLISLESKVDLCTEYIKKQSEISRQQSVMSC